MNEPLRTFIGMLLCMVLVLMAFMLLPSTAWGLELIGAKDSANTNYLVDTMGLLHVIPTAKRYTAVAGDTVRYVGAWSQTADSVILGLYRWDDDGDSLTTCFASDTFAVGTGSQYDSSLVNWALEGGVTYVMTGQCGDKSGNVVWWKRHTAGPDTILQADSMQFCDDYAAADTSLYIGAWTIYATVDTSGRSYTCDPWGSTTTATQVSWGANVVYVDSFTTPNCTGTLDSLRCRIGNNNNGDDEFQLVLYDDNSGKPGTLIDSTAADSIKTSTMTIFTLPAEVGGAVNGNTVYWVGLYAKTANNIAHSATNTPSGPNTVEYKTGQSQIPTTWGTSSGSDALYEIYLEAYYTETAAATKPKRKRKN